MIYTGKQTHICCHSVSLQKITFINASLIFLYTYQMLTYIEGGGICNYTSVCSPDYISYTHLGRYMHNTLKIIHTIRSQGENFWEKSNNVIKKKNQQTKPQKYQLIRH